MSLFGSTSTPKWLSPDERNAGYDELGRAAGSSFSKSFNSASARTSSNVMSFLQMGMGASAEAAVAGKLKTAAGLFAEGTGESSGAPAGTVTTDTESKAPAWQSSSPSWNSGGSSSSGSSSPAIEALKRGTQIIGKNPWMLADKDTAPFAGRYMKWLTDNAKIEQGASLAQTKMELDKTKIDAASAVVKSFDTQVGSLAKTHPDLASPFLPHMGKPASPVIYDALGKAMETAKLRDENKIAQAALEAQQRGDQATTTITDKGVSTRYTPPKAADATSNEPKQKVLADGEVVTWMPGGKAFKVKSDGTKKDITPLQLRQFADKLNPKDPDRQGILDAAKRGIMDQLKAKSAKPAADTTADPTPTGVRKYNPATDAFE